MKKMGKQANIWVYVGFTLTLVLAMVGIFALCLGSHTRTRADSVEAATSGDWTYTVASNKATITAYSGTATDLTIPSTLGGYSVTQIGSSSASATFLTNVRTTLTKVTIPASVTTINQYAFRSCTALVTFAYADNIGANITYINSNAFLGCNGLTTFRIPDGIVHIGNTIFSGCANLNEVIIPCKSSTSSAIDLGYAALSRAKKFSVTTPASGIKPLYGVDAYGVLMKYKYVNNVGTLYNIVAFPTMYTGDSNNSYTIPNTVEAISDFAFTGASIKTLKISTNSPIIPAAWGTGQPDNSITRYEVVGTFNTSGYYNKTNDDSLYYKANDGTRYLIAYPHGKTTPTTIAIADVEVIGQSAFYAYSKIQSLVLDEGVTTLGNRAFWKCGNLASVSLPASLSTMPNQNFTQCPVSSLTINPNNPYFKAVDNCIYTKDGKTLRYISCRVPTSLSLLDGVENIWAGSGYSQDNNKSVLQSLIIPASVTNIQAESLYGHGTLSNITFMHTSLPDSFNIAKNAFTNINASLQVNLQNRNVYNYFKSHFTTSQFTNAPSCFKCLDYTVTLTLNNNGDTSTKLYSWGNGSNYSMYSNANHTTSASSVTVPTRTGYTFDGYWLDKDGDSTQYITKTGTFVSGIADIDADSTLYAHWIPATPLLWSTLGGAAKIYPVDSKTGMVRAEVTEAYAGYTFAGWSLNDGTNISSYTVEGGNPKKVVDIPVSVLNGKILIASFKQNNTVVDTYANTTHNYLVATTNGGYARILGENASATAVRIRAQTTDPDYKFSHWTLTNLGTGEVTKLLNGMPLTETEDYVSF
ncbi:MAG: leucine-rich repeat protein, partial [Clostridia bacterium]|nr:leucine-rich repeat protein [Clostridia bacterium]